MFYMKPNEPSTEFGKRLKDIRKARGLTQTKLAEISGIPGRLIVHYETYEKNHP